MGIPGFSFVQPRNMEVPCFLHPFFFVSIVELFLAHCTHLSMLQNIHHSYNGVISVYEWFMALTALHHKRDKIPASNGERERERGTKSHPSSWNCCRIDNCWEESVFLKGVVPGRSVAVLLVDTGPRVDGEHKLDSIFFF